MAWCILTYLSECTCVRPQTSSDPKSLTLIITDSSCLILETDDHRGSHYLDHIKRYFGHVVKCISDSLGTIQSIKSLIQLWKNKASEGCKVTRHTLSEETAHPTVYHLLSQVSVDMQLSGLIKCREDLGVLILTISGVAILLISQGKRKKGQWTRFLPCLSKIIS